MDLQSTLVQHVLQLKHVPRPRLAVAGVVQKIMKTLYEAHFRNAEDRRPGRNPACPNSDILVARIIGRINDDAFDFASVIR